MRKKRIFVRGFALLLCCSTFFSGGLLDDFFVQNVCAKENEINLREDYSFDETSTWDTNKGKENNISLTTEDIPVAGLTLKMDVLIPGDSEVSFSNILKPVGILRIGDNWDWVQSNNIPELRASDFDEEIVVDEVKYHKAEVEIVFDETVGANGTDGWDSNMNFEDAVTDTVKQVTVQFAGYLCDYSGEIAIANARLEEADTKPTEDIYVDATLKPQGKAVTDIDIASSIKLVDAEATDKTKAIYAYLSGVGKTDNVIFGHQNDTWHKAGSKALSNSDTYDVVESISGIVGIDALSLTGNEYSASRFNEELADELGEDMLPETAKGNVEAAAKLTNYNIDRGAIITLSAHMPNFSKVSVNEDFDADVEPSYAKYDFSGYTPNVIENDVMNEILPEGKYHSQFTAYLDMIADYADSVDGAILFRPFHENTGSWFWWGKAFCDASTYKNVYRYTVDYLRDEKDIHNLIYVYGPGSEASSVDEYLERYPGDEYVDMVGFDMYHSNPTVDDNWFDDFTAEMNIVNDFAAAHNKLFAVTETGVASDVDKGDNQTALHKSSNDCKDWYNKMLDTVSDSSASYFLLWANFGKRDGYYTPYVESKKDDIIHGHEMMDNFISFYNDDRSIFAADQKEYIDDIVAGDIENNEVSSSAFGYIVTPVSGKRILKGCVIKAKVHNEGDNSITLVFKNGKNEKKLEAKQDDFGYYEAQLTDTALKELGEGVGSISLWCDDELLDSISAMFNMEAPEINPYEVDDFENYFGEDSLLKKEWATNKASGSDIDITLTSDKCSSGDYAMKFSYNEKVGGWAGATISKEADWSNCNALSLWTIPDRNAQKVVVQITAAGKEYEVYLNEYDEYINSEKPLYVTIPFDKFVDRDNDGPTGGLPKLTSKISSVGLWVNQIGSSSVSGTIIYDEIEAVNVDCTQVTFSEKKSGADDQNKSFETPKMQEKEEPKPVENSDSKKNNEHANESNSNSSNSNSSNSNSSNSNNAGVTSSANTTKVDLNETVIKQGTVTEESNATVNRSSKKKANISGVKNSYKIKANKKSFVLKAKGHGKLSFVSSDSSVVTVGKNNGKVKIKGVGEAYITITDFGNSKYSKTNKRVKIVVTPNNVSGISYKTNAKNDVEIKWKKQKGVTGYQVEYAKNKSFKDSKVITVKGAKNSIASIDKNAFENNCYIRIRSYKKCRGKNIFGAYSKAKKIVMN